MGVKASAQLLSVRPPSPPHAWGCSDQGSRGDACQQEPAPRPGTGERGSPARRLPKAEQRGWPQRPLCEDTCCPQQVPALVPARSKCHIWSRHQAGASWPCHRHPPLPAQRAEWTTTEQSKVCRLEHPRATDGGGSAHGHQQRLPPGEGGPAGRGGVPTLGLHPTGWTGAPRRPRSQHPGLGGTGAPAAPAKHSRQPGLGVPPGPGSRGACGAGHRRTRGRLERGAHTLWPPSTCPSAPRNASTPRRGAR